MKFLISPTLQKAILHRVKAAEGNGHYISVYSAAQEIQDAHPYENVALEDIVAAFVDMAGGRSIALEFSQRRWPGEIPVEIIVSETA